MIDTIILSLKIAWLAGAEVSASGWGSGGPRFQSHPRLTFQSCSRYQLNQLGSKAASESTFEKSNTCGVSNNRLYFTFHTVTLKSCEAGAIHTGPWSLIILVNETRYKLLVSRSIPLSSRSIIWSQSRSRNGGSDHSYLKDQKPRTTSLMSPTQPLSLFITRNIDTLSNPLRYTQCHVNYYAYNTIFAHYLFYILMIK